MIKIQSVIDVIKQLDTNISIINYLWSTAVLSYRAYTVAHHILASIR